MDPRLFDTVWMAYREVSASEPIHVVCGYRAPETNAMLRRRSRGVAKFSQHTLGKAMDFYIPGVNLSTLRIAGLRLQRGGVGFYPTSGSPFVHMDAGSVRMWPRMSRTELASVFPDGKTVLIPADGKPMPGYQAAFAEVIRKGSSVGGVSGGADEDSGGAEGAGSGLGSILAAAFSPAPPSSGRAGESVQSVLLADSQRRSQPAAQVVVAAAAARPAATPDNAPPVRVVVATNDIPLPEPRPAEIRSPPMAWQAGPPGQQVAEATPGVPLPPSRPSETAADATASLDVAALPQSQGTRTTSATAVIGPARPVMSDLSRGIDDLLSKRRPPAGGQALGYASDDRIIPIAVAQGHPLLISTRFEKLSFRTVSRPLPTARDKGQAGLTMPDLDSVATLIPAPAKVVLIRFGVAAYQDLRSEHFSGSAIRPLRTASFAFAPELITGSIAPN